MASDKDTIATLTAQVATLTAQLATATTNLNNCTAGRAADAAKAAATLQLTKDQDAAALKTVTEDRDGWRQKCSDGVQTNAACVEELRMANARIATLSVPLPGKPYVDAGAADLMAYVSTRMPGLKASDSLGGPSLTDPHKEIAAGRETMTMELECEDGRLYKIEVFRVGSVE